MWVFSITDTYLWIFNLIGVNIFVLMRIHKGGTFLPLPNEVSYLCRSGTGEFSNASHRLQFIANTPFFKQALLIQDAKTWYNIMVPNCWWRVSNLKVNFVFKLFFQQEKPLENDLQYKTFVKWPLSNPPSKERTQFICMLSSIHSWNLWHPSLSIKKVWLVLNCIQLAWFAHRMRD